MPSTTLVARPTPINVLGDSHVFAFSDRMYRSEWDELFLFRSLYCPGLRTRDFVGPEGDLDERVRAALQVGRVMVDSGDSLRAIHRTNNLHWRWIGELDDRQNVDPALAITTGSIDTIEVALRIPQTDIVLPDAIRDHPATPEMCRTAAPGALAAAEAERMFAAPIEPLRAVLRILRERGLTRVAVLGLPPMSLDDDECDVAYTAAGFPLVRRANNLAWRYKVTLLMNGALRRLCGEEAVAFVDRWAAFTQDGLVRPGVLRDFIHLTEESVGRISAQIIDVAGASAHRNGHVSSVTTNGVAHVASGDEGAYAYHTLFEGRKLEDPRLAAVHALAAAGSGSRVLTIGCGRGELSYAFAAGGAEVTTIDESSDAIAAARATVDDASVRFVCGDVTKFRDDTRYDVAVASNAIERIPTDELPRLYVNLATMLAPHGSLVVHAKAGNLGEQSPAALRWQLRGAFEHVLLWAGSADDPVGSLARPCTAAELRAAPDVFAIASDAPIDLENVLARITTQPLSEADTVAEISALSAPPRVPAADDFVAKLTLRNDGAARLTSFAPNPIRFAYTWSNGNGKVVGDDRGRSRVEPGAQPWSTGRYALRITAPQRPGRHVLRVMLVQELVRWFDAHAEVAIDVE